MAAEVLVVDEAPSLGGSVVGLLEADGIGVRRFADLETAEQYHVGTHATHPVVVVASNAHYCPSASRWALGPLHDADLVVVGTRDPALRSAGRLHVIRLPLDPQQLLEMVRTLIAPKVHRPPERPA